MATIKNQIHDFYSCNKGDAVASGFTKKTCHGHDAVVVAQLPLLRLASRFKVLIALAVLSFGFGTSALNCVAQAPGSTFNPSSNSQLNGNSANQTHSQGYLNFQLTTLGGAQFWTDVRHAGKWRIQQNSETNHCRLLDQNNVRQAWGNRLHCEQKLNEAITARRTQLNSGKLVIVLHGLVRTSNSMATMANFLENKDGYSTINFQYASTRKSVGQHAMALRSVVDNLGPEVTEIHFVGHSLGNIVVRRYLADSFNSETGVQGDPRIKRIVMIGPPNQGSTMAQILRNSFLFSTIAGVSGSELSRTWNRLAPTLATPKVEFGIIAGGQASERNLNNFILKGPDDFTVSVEEAKLPGATDLLVRPLLHSTMMHQPVTLNATFSFLENGYFISAQARRPILADGSAPQNVGDLRTSSVPPQTGGK